MPLCVAVGCRNDAFSKHRENGVSFYSFPKDVNLQKRWQANIKTENITKNPKPCPQRFQNSCFKGELDVTLWYSETSQQRTSEIAGMPRIVNKTFSSKCDNLPEITCQQRTTLNNGKKILRPIGGCYSEVSLYFYVNLLLKVGKNVYNGEFRCILLGLHAMVYYFNNYRRF